MAKVDDVKEVGEQRFAKPGVVVELIQGDQWVDDLSGISLYRGFYRLASKDELRSDKMAKKFGYIMESEKQTTAKLPEKKDLSRVEKAIRLGILKIYDPNNPTIYKERAPSQSRRVIDGREDSGSRYSTIEEEKITYLLKMKHADFVQEIKKFKSLDIIEKIYEAECEGRNPTAAPRKMYVDVIKGRFNANDVSGVSRISSKESERIIIE